ncbi:GLUT4 regulating protein TUG-domain-containing protein [Xylariaceae sp. FL0594]|nr:GLUT4 regulating protein TUG-domain-containing protein [Xylariaceae sp. FL0594]
MATNVKVVGTDLRQVTIKVTPGTYLTEILEQACTKLKVPHDKFLLKHKQRQLDLSQTFRTSGLIPGARLELVVRANTPSVVNVALQLPAPESGLFPPHGRVSDKLPSDFTIWQVLRQFESGKASAGKNLNITARGVTQINNGAQAGSGQLYYEIPHVVIENRTLSSFVDFQKTLSQLGYNSGGVLIRLSFHRTDRPLADAMSEIEQYFKEDVPDSAAAPKPDDGRADKKPITTSQPAAEQSETQGSTSEAPVVSTQTVPQPTTTEEPSSTAQQPAPNPDAMDVDVDEEEKPTGRRPVTIFSAPSGSTPAAALRADSEEDYTPDISHAKAHQRLLKSLGANKRLLSDQELEQKAAAEEARVAAVRSIKVKVRFPDNFSAEWEFGPDDSGASLYAEVRRIMANDSSPFKLLLPGARPLLIKDGDGGDAANKLIKGYGLNGNTLVNFVWDDAVPADIRRQPFLKGSAANRAQQVVVPDVPEIEVKEEEGPSAQAPAPKPNNEGDSSGFKKPKWLKGLTKK